ncbi:PAS domain-containing protein [Leptospira idonii]|uniref:histidine kinase n=1 Tax=Leptospira idonii TaxID=1193500 RepID=A0A4R9M0I1_9LEPT|nr:PAS domain-containing protein [Leptospira idonii]TGN20170.1 PAS domain S-box protein [Leptospira idonii]
MNSMIKWLEFVFAFIPLSLLEVWGRFGYIIGLFLMVAAFGGFTFRPGGKWGIGREKLSWDAQALFSVVLTFVLIFITGYLGSLIVLVPGAQTFESVKDLSVFCSIVLFGYPALLAVPFAYGLSDLIEGVPPQFLLDWFVGYFINPACFWVAYQLIGRNPDFRKAKTWAWYFVFVLIFMGIEPQLWGYICSGQFTSEISYRNITPALFFTTSITWIIAPFFMLVAFPLARKYGLFWAEIPGHVKEVLLSYKERVWESGRGEISEANSQGSGLPIRMFLVTPFIILVLVMVGMTAYLTLSSSEAAADKLASRLHQEISENINLLLDEYLEKSNPNRPKSSYEIHSLLKRTNIAEHGRAFVMNRNGILIASSLEEYPDREWNAKECEDLVIRNAVVKINEQFGSLDLLKVPSQFRFDIVTAKPLSRETWFSQVTPYESHDGNENWLVVTVMPASYYLAGVREGNSQSATIFAISLTLSLLIATLLAGIVAAPLRKISLASHAIASGDLTQRVPSSGLAELGALSSSFNHMAEQLQESFELTKASEDRFRKLAETIQDVFWIISPNQDQLFYVSPAYETIWGRTCESLYESPRDWLDAIHPEEQSRVEEAFRKQSDGNYNEEYRIIRPDGSIRWIHDRGFLVYNEDGVLEKIVGIARDVSVQKKADEDLRNSQKQFKDLVDTTPGVVWEADAVTFNFTFVSKQAVDLLGYSYEEWMVPGFWADHIYSEDRDEAVNFCVTSTNRLEAHNFEYRFLCKDGRIVWLRDLVKVIVIDGKPKWLRGVMVDITERKKMEERLFERNQFIESILDITPDILYIYDIIERKNVYSNNGIHRVLGYSSEELKNMGEQMISDLMHPDDFKDYLEKVIPRYEKASDKDLIEHQYRMKHRDGSWRWLISRELIYERTASGRPKKIFGITNDITKNKQAEETILDLNANLEKKIDIRTEELRKSNQDLTEAIGYQKKVMKDLQDTQDQLLTSEKLAALGQLAAGMTHELNTPLGAIVSSNRAILDIVNLSMKEIPYILSGLDEADTKRFGVLLEASLKDASLLENIPSRALRKEFIAKFKEAQVPDYEKVANTVMDAGVYKLGDDLLDLLRTEKRNEILKAVSSFSTISRLSNVISVATGKASHVVDALKNYLNPGGKNEEEEIVPVDIISEIETILTLYQGKIKYGVDIVKRFDTTERCLGNGNKLNQVWINLLNNSLQSMDYKGKIEIQVEKKDSWIVTSFIDSGKGIPDEIKSKIFLPFFTTKKHGEGIGLGLDICKKIIEKMGGKIEFESVPGRTKFSVYLTPAESIR